MFPFFSLDLCQSKTLSKEIEARQDMIYMFGIANELYVILHFFGFHIIEGLVMSSCVIAIAVEPIFGVMWNCHGSCMFVFVSSSSIIWFPSPFGR